MPAIYPGHSEEEVVAPIVFTFLSILTSSYIREGLFSILLHWGNGTALWLEAGRDLPASHSMDLTYPSSPLSKHIEFISYFIL